VYIKHTTTHVLPAFTDAFLTETVGIISEKLADYEGSTLTEKYRSYIREKLEEDYENRLLEATEKKFWQKIVQIAEVKRVPRAAMLEVYDDYILDLESTYQSYLKSMGATEVQYPFATFCNEYFANSLAEGERYTSYVKRLSEQTAGEKIIFFYAIQLLGVAPNESELAEAYKEIVHEFGKQNALLDESYYENQATEEAKKKAYEEYVAELEKTKKALVETLGEEYFLESAYYNHSFPKLLALTKITYQGKGHE
jgi:FKBP-type peptidyl-prolyl cis-trans isomerase (trigger factor)